MANTKIPVELSSTPSIVDNGNATAITIDSSENVGIGGSPTNYSDHKTLSLYGNTGTGAGFIEFNDTSGNADAVIFSDNGNLFINADYDNTTADSSIRFRVDGSSEKMRIDSSGNLIMTAGGTIRAGGVNDLILDAGESGTPDIYLQSGGATKVKIEGSNGNVGIGTDSISGRLEIKKATTSNETIFAIEAEGATTTTLGSITYDQTDDSMRLLNNSTFSGTTLRLGTVGSDDVIIDNDGNVGIGTDNPDTLLHLSNDGTTPATIRIERNDTTISDTNIYGSIEFEGQDNSAASAAGIRGKILGVAEGSTGEMALTFETAGGYGSSTERMRIDSSGTVGIGVSTPSGSGVLGTGHKLVTRADTNSSYVTTGGTGRLPAGLEIATQNTYQANDSLSGFAMQSNGAGGATMGGYIGFLPASTFSGGSIVIGATTGSNSHAERIRITNEGITFNGDTAATNALDDYEEGSFTASLQNTGNATPPTGAGQYCKIGGVVYVSMYFAGITISSAGNTRIAGLPFSASSPNSAYSICYYTHGNILSDNRGGGGYFTGTFIDLIAFGSTGYNSWSTGSGKYGMWSGFYFTNS